MADEKRYQVMSGNEVHDGSQDEKDIPHLIKRCRVLGFNNSDQVIWDMKTKRIIAVVFGGKKVMFAEEEPKNES